MRVIWSADDDGIDVLSFHQLAIVLSRHDVGCRASGIAIEFLRQHLPVCGALAIDIAHRDIVHATRLERAGHVMSTGNAATTDLTHAYAIARRICTEDAGRNDERHRERCRGGSKTFAEVAARNRWLFHAGCSLLADLTILIEGPIGVLGPKLERLFTRDCSYRLYPSSLANRGCGDFTGALLNSAREERCMDPRSPKFT